MNSDVAPMRPSASVEKAIGSDGTELAFEPNDITVFVGPNNSGKSEVIRNLWQLLGNGKEGKAIRSIQIRKSQLPDIVEWFQDNGTIEREPNDAKVIGRWGVFSTTVVRAIWDSFSHLDSLAPFFGVYLSTEARLNAAKAPKNFASTNSIPSHPIQWMYREDEVEAKISTIFHQAFGQDLIVHRGGGNEIPLFVGERPARLQGEDRTATRYLREIEKHGRLEAQGDGMRSFAGIVLHTFASAYTMVLIDEPEAFLHPPQARSLARSLAQNPQGEQQMFLATHSGDLLRGLLDAASTRVRVIRMTRSGTTNRFTELSNADLRLLWSDPILRYSQILEGVFHEKVVICESDSDCRFYAAVADALSSPVAVDALYLHCGGKTRLHVAARALKALDVPVAVVADFDVLNNEHPLSTIVESLGGDWSTIEPHWRVVKAEIEQKKPELATTEVVEQITKELASTTGPMFPKASRDRILEILRRSSPWDSVKRQGSAAVPSGNATKSLAKLFAECSRLGLHIVPVGELESFVRTVGGHGPAWLNEVLQRNLGTDPELEAARDFVRRLLGLSRGPVGH